jgi:hypothetical protein
MLIYVFNLPQINIIATTVLYFIVLLNGFKCDWKLSIFHTLLLLTVMVISEVIVIYIVSFLYDVPTNQFEKDNILFVEETFISKLVYFILLAIVSSFSKKTKLTEGLLSSVFLTILPLMTFFVAVIFLYQSIDYGIDTNMKMFFVAIELLMFLANVIVFSVHERSISNQKKLHDMEMVEQKQTINLEYLDILERKDEETRIFIHDIRNNLINISNLTDEENVKNYIQEIYDKSNDISVKAKTKNRLLDVIINKYNLLCKDKNISFNILSINENLSFMSDYDISAILDNLLRNAIESAENENNPYISLSLESDNKFHKIILKNSCSTKPIEDKNNLVTTKSNKNIHGYGMKSVIKALNNYNGELEWAYNNNEFKIIILIPA